MKAVQTLLLLGFVALPLACGYSSHASMPPQPGVMPAITALAPNSESAGSGDFTLTVNGSNFSTKSVVNWNGAAHTTSFVSANQLTAGIAAADIATPATVSVTVTNPGTTGTGLYGGGGTTAETSNSMNFTVN
ncbi:MAG TPA: IPT/TIG domain-containing protein [Candidatus Sulfotelmatobacter sp.]